MKFRNLNNLNITTLGRNNNLIITSDKPLKEDIRILAKIKEAF